MNRKRNLLAALGLGLVGTLLLVAYVRAAEGRATAGQRLAPVVVLSEDVPKGASPTELRAAVEVVRLPASARSAGVLTSLDGLDGRVPTADLYAGEQLLTSRLGDPEQVGRDLPDDEVAVALSLERQRAVGGHLAPGTKVEVLASWEDPGRTEVVLRDVRVQAVADEGDAGAPVLVTLGVPSDRVEALVSAAERSRLWLVGTSGVALPAEAVR